MDRIPAADALAAGRPVVLVDDLDPGRGGDLVLAASLATPTLLAFAVRHTSGFVCVALPGSTCDQLRLSPMRHDDPSGTGTAYQVTVDLHGVGTGISATARAATITALASPTSTATDFVRPGHVVPLRARSGGVLSRPGHTEAAVDLARLAGLPSAAALSAIVSRERPSHLAHGAELDRFAREHQLATISLTELIGFRRRREPQVRRIVETSLPTRHGRFRAVGYADLGDGAEHVALLAGPVDPSTPVHVHVECLTGDALGSTGCPCRRRLDRALSTFATDGRGIVVYVRPTRAVRACGLPGSTDHRGTATAERILADLGVINQVDPDMPATARLDARPSAATSGGRAAG
ncbi:3,4-dihydroxy-2-butanone-4-phosphate synthase [Pseudonocardia sp. CA-107938]|uniref:3,4-dihydroxy-2-butanone-4-phosphate synthase n=1 Tax=Pseudonocardia sp. CA-107938 TaxID=3240021 RepID=UPI003D92F21B